MKKITTTQLSEEAVKTSGYFRSLPESWAIGSACALHFLGETLRRENPKTILEFGGGIGEISYFMLKYSSAHVDIYEDNATCIRELKKNLKGFEGRYTILTDYTDTNLPHDSYELIVLDGEPYNLIGNAIRKTKNLRSVFFEGKRWAPQEIFHDELKHKYTFQYRKYDQLGIEPKLKKCAYEIVCTPNTNPFARYAGAKWNKLFYMRNMFKEKRFWRDTIKKGLKNMRLFNIAISTRNMFWHR